MRVRLAVAAVFAASVTCATQARATLYDWTYGGDGHHSGSGILTTTGATSPFTITAITGTFDGGERTYPNGCHISEVEIDTATGEVAMVRYTAVDDVGHMINPMLVEGQLHGGVAMGVGQALMENMVYDRSGQGASRAVAQAGMAGRRSGAGGWSSSAPSSVTTSCSSSTK